MSRLPRLSARNLALGYVLVSVVVLAAFTAWLWVTWREDIEEGRTDILKKEAQALIDIFDERGTDALSAVIDARVGQRLIGNAILLFTDPAGARLAGNLPAWPSNIPSSTGLYRLNFNVYDRNVRSVVFRTALPGGYNLLVGRDTTRFYLVEMRFWYGLIAAGSFVLIVGVASAWMIRRALLSEVHRMSQTAAGIVGGDLSRRLPVDGGTNELAMLAQVVNLMLDQIEQLIHGVRNVSNAIAHDLRTPLAELRARLEELSLTRPPREEIFAEIETAVADVDRVIGIFNALLRLAEIDTGARRSGFVQVDVAEVGAEAVEFYQPVAEQKGVRLSFVSAAALTATGDRLLLVQAIANLIDNALKYAPADGKIVVEAGPHADGTIKIAVCDNGPGIPDDEKVKVTERFYRSDASRGTPGVGLGLSLVAAVAKVHGGALELADNHPGLRAILVLPSEKSPLNPLDTARSLS